jgi:hypothetical protein
MDDPGCCNVGGWRDIEYCPLHEAAPDLLAALRKLLNEYAEQVEGEGWDSRPLYREYQPIIDKAEGVTHDGGGSRS